VGQAQGCGGEKQDCRCRVAAAGEDVDHDRCRMDALVERFSASSFDRLQAIVGNAAEDLTHLSVSIVAPLELASDRRHCRGQHPVLERGSIT